MGLEKRCDVPYGTNQSYFHPEGNILNSKNVDYKLHIEEFFATWRKLNNMGLNQKTQITSKHVIDVAIMELFGKFLGPQI